MNPVTHFLAGWALANTVPMERRDRLIVTLAAVAPDFDGLGIIGNLVTRGSESPLYWWEEYHHVLGHNLGFALALTIVTLVVAERRLATSLLVLASAHLHFLGDLVGARGPEGYQWPIPYLKPFADVWNLTWEGQWFLNAWPNFLITGILLALTLYMTWRKGFSPLDLLSQKADRALVETIRGRFGDPTVTSRK